MALAERFSRQALAISPLDVDATVLLALVCARTGKRAAAIAYLQNAVRRAPGNFEAHVALSTLLFSAGRAEEAILHGKRSVELRPDELEVYQHFARDLISHGQHEDAMVVLRRAAELFPVVTAVRQDLAATLSDLGRAREASQQWEKALELSPDLLVGWLKLGGFRLASMDFDGAIVCGREAVKTDDNSADAHLLLALGLSERNGAREAESHLRRAIELNPDEYLAYAALGLVLQELGRFAEAQTYLEISTVLKPTHGLPYTLLLRTRKVTIDDEPLLLRIESLTKHAEAADIDRSNMHYALGKAREDLHEFAAAMEHYDEANKLAAEVSFADQPFDGGWYQFMIQRTIETFTPELLESIRARGSESELPLVVVGMMRSGTTLVEQILSSHPAIDAGGELTYWHEHVSEAFDPALRKVDEKKLFQIAQGYVKLLAGVGTGAPRVTDKLPHNYAMLGLVHAAFPRARIIHVKRNPLDNCLSIYSTPYQKPPAFALVRGNIVFAYRQYRRLMDHWRGTLPSNRLLEVDYEELISNRELVTRRLIDFVGLDWDEACLRHENNERSVNTPSVWQVRQPVYQTSVDRWRKFEPWLREFAELKDLC